MEPTIHELLDAADDPVHTESDPTLDWPTIYARVDAIRPELERIAGRAFVESNVQDASFFTELSIERPGAWQGLIDTVFSIRFSGFGRLFTTWTHCEVEQLPPEVISELVAAVSRAGFRYVSASALDIPYTGRHPGFANSSWRTRFFDYL